MNRRKFLHQFGAYLTATSAVCGVCRPALAQWPDQNIVPASGYPLQGCSLIGNLSNFGGGRIHFLHSTYNPQMDQVIFKEANILAYVTGMRPSLAFLDDRNSPNAFATSQDIVNYSSPHGAVVLGIVSVNNMLRAGDFTAVVAVLVHEWAHIAQFQAGVRSRTRTVAPTELMADFIAGWYHGFRCTRDICQADPRYAESGLANIGDYNTHLQEHHGTPMQRATAYREGYNFVYSGGGGGINGFRQLQNQFLNFNNPYGIPGYGGGQGSQAQDFGTAFSYAARKFVGY